MSTLPAMRGPLHGIRVVELAGIGPGPFCGMVLADHGAEVIRLERPGQGLGPIPDLGRRGRRSVVLDLKQPEAVEAALRLVETADAVIEGFRPGVAERLGLGPEACLDRNPRLVYGRITGWGQDGPLASTAGHDLDYIALSGVLGAIGRRGAAPVPPLNLVGDYGGGGLLAAFGVVAALLEAQATGEGQVVDVAMVDGSALLAQPIYELLGQGWWEDQRGVNLLDGGSPFYDTYETADGRYLAVGPLEPQFFAELIELLGLEAESVPSQLDPAGWPGLRQMLAERFRTRTRDEWMEVFQGSDACVAPVLSLREAPTHPHNRARGTFVEVDGVTQPGPAPRFGRHGRVEPAPSPTAGADGREILAELGYEPDTLDRLIQAGVLGQPGPREESNS